MKEYSTGKLSSINTGKPVGYIPKKSNFTEHGYQFSLCKKCERKMLNIERQAEKFCFECEYEE